MMDLAGSSSSKCICRVWFSLSLSLSFSLSLSLSLSLFPLLFPVCCLSIDLSLSYSFFLSFPHSVLPSPSLCVIVLSLPFHTLSSLCQTTTFRFLTYLLLSGPCQVWAGLTWMTIFKYRPPLHIEALSGLFESAVMAY